MSPLDTWPSYSRQWWTISFHKDIPTGQKKHHRGERRLELEAYQLGDYSKSLLGFSCGSDSKESPCNAGDLGSIPGLGRSPEEGNGNPLQYFCLKNSMDRGVWLATVHGVMKKGTWLSDLHFHCAWSNYPVKAIYPYFEEDISETMWVQMGLKHFLFFHRETFSHLIISKLTNAFSYV